jgi:hypothetical protein
VLALSDDEGDEPVHFRVRETCEDAEAFVEDGTVRSTWRPWADVEVTTWLTAAGPWHLRTHRIRSGRALHTAEGGFAVDREGEGTRRETGPGRALAAGPAGDLSGLADLPEPGAAPREGQVVEVLPGTNVLARRTALPTLLARLPAGEHWLRCAVLGAGPGQAAAWQEAPPAARY